jgi:hypothetical protein
MLESNKQSTSIRTVLECMFLEFLEHAIGDFFFDEDAMRCEYCAVTRKDPLVCLSLRSCARSFFPRDCGHHFLWMRALHAWYRHLLTPQRSYLVEEF